MTGGQERREAAGVLLFFALGAAAIAATLFTLGPEPGAARRSATAQDFTSALEAARAHAELRRTADLVVDREPSGTLVVSGRALKARVRVSSTDELKALLRNVPGPGMAVVNVDYPSREILAAVEDAGYRRAALPE